MSYNIPNLTANLHPFLSLVNRFLLIFIEQSTNPFPPAICLNLKNVVLIVQPYRIYEATQLIITTYILGRSQRKGGTNI